MPVLPSTSISEPSGIRREASAAETTHGIPSSRLTMIACESGAPTSTTTADAGTTNGVHDGSVMGATSTSPGPRSPGSPASRTMRALPRATPGQPAPVRPESTPDVGAPAWTEEAEQALGKVPFFVRGKARRNTEHFAQERGIDRITVDTLYDAKSHFSS